MAIQEVTLSAINPMIKGMIATKIQTIDPTFLDWLVSRVGVTYFWRRPRQILRMMQSYAAGKLRSADHTVRPLCGLA